MNEVLAYGAAQRQAWDNTDLGGPWLNLMRNALNSQIWSFKHADFLAVSVTHGTAQLALFDQAIWDKYQLTRLAGEDFETNRLIIGRKAAAADPANYENAAGPFSVEDNSIPALMQRGVVSCPATMRSGNRQQPLSSSTSILTGSLTPRSQLN